MNFYSVIILVATFGLIASFTFAGRHFRLRAGNVNREEDFHKLITGAALSLLGLLIGFTLSMAIGGFNSRQSSEENEAIAIRAAMQKSSLLSPENQKIAIALLEDYLTLRVELYESAGSEQRGRLREEALNTQRRLWEVAASEARRNPTPINALVVNAFTDLSSSQQRTISYWRRQVPLAAWALLLFIAGCCGGLIGYSAGHTSKHDGMLLIMPAIIALAFLTIAEIDAPGEGIIRVSANNLKTISLE
ncbi:MULTISPECIES: hypothetical protein [Stenotrophomonas]|uniref:bestrophin-like domain n=1 Tax=Stenotrophomonas TaxID=40323 RepID=UPI0008A2E154|nr:MULTISPECIES: hypothetical protein [Stenotrophomonas]OFU89047.1 hypothetical protein HMPREF3114_18435 [Stenotrophomonas sp. HMSC10F07]